MVVGELAVLVGKEEELGESGGCEERFHSQAKKRPGPDSECHAGRRQLLFAVRLFPLLGFCSTQFVILQWAFL